MQNLGKVTAIQRDFLTNKIMLTLMLDNALPTELQQLSSEEKYQITIEKQKKKRSLDANGLLWVCLGEIAVELCATKWEVYLQMLRRYGKYTYIVVKENVVDSVKKQWRECEVIGEIDIHGDKGVQMLCYFGSSTYNSKEFSTLLDGVISEMRELGLHTPTSKEMRRAIDRLEKNEQNAVSIG